jgi:aryl-alcohol dehydrogenase-like predicted oxidoreductase
VLGLPAVGFGAFKVGRNQGTKYPAAYDLPDDAAAATLLNGVLDSGIRYIDTAPAYGSSEERIGRFIGHRRGEYMVSTKVGEHFTDGMSTYDFSAAAVRESVARSQRRLRRDVLDLVFVHAGRDDLYVLSRTEVVPTLQALKQDGAIRAIGFSGYSAAAFRASLDWCDAIMVAYHPEDRSLEPVIAEAAGRDITVVVKKGLASGRLAPAMAVPFVLSNRNVTSMLIGTIDLSHVQEILRLAETVRGGVRGPGGAGEPADIPSPVRGGSRFHA